jgi:preprotein translocase subunit SecF
MKDLFVFDEMLTPKIITFVYWLFLLVSVVSGLGTMFSGSFLMGVGIVVGGIILSRIYCELLIVLFKIHENVKKLAEKE